jgi:hypothetical protein
MEPKPFSTSITWIAWTRCLNPCVFMNWCSCERGADLSVIHLSPLLRRYQTVILIACHAKSSCPRWRNLKPHSSGNCWNYTVSSVALLRLGYKDLDILTTTRCRKYEMRSCGMHDISIRWCMLVALFSLGRHCTLKNNRVIEGTAVINHNQCFSSIFRDIVVMLNMSWKKPWSLLTW